MRIVRRTTSAPAKATVYQQPWDILGADYSKGGKYLVVYVNEDSRYIARVLDPATFEVIPLRDMPAGLIRGVSISQDDASLAFYASDGSVPDELYVRSFAGEPTRLTNALHATIRREDLVVPSVVRFKSYDGVEVTGLLYRPHQASSDAKAPAIVRVHGGPGGQAKVGYNALTQALVNRGYVVFDINNRGSSGYGKTFYTWTTASTVKPTSATSSRANGCSRKRASSTRRKSEFWVEATAATWCSPRQPHASCGTMSYPNTRSCSAHLACRPRRLISTVMASYDDIIRKVIPDAEFHQNRYARELHQVVRPGCRWLDIGAGSCLHSGWLGPSEEELVARADCVMGCDRLPTPLASNRFLTASVAADASRLPFADETFDLVTANMVLEHLSDPFPVFAEVARVLVPAGTFLFVTPNRRNPATWLASILLRPAWRRKLAERIEGRPPQDVFLTCYRANTETAVRRLATESFLRVRQLEVFRSYPILRRPSAAVLLEAIWIRALRWPPLRAFGSNLIGQLEKPFSPTAAKQ